jgi:hypothetical protein
VVYGDVYELAQEVPPCDVVLIGQILVNLQNPIAVLIEASKVAKEYLVVVEGRFEDYRPTTALFIGRKGMCYGREMEPAASSRMSG